MRLTVSIGQIPDRSMVRTKSVIHVADLRPTRVVPRAIRERCGSRAWRAFAPPLGADAQRRRGGWRFAIYRQEVRPFTDKQSELVQNFAAQAVIAIENTRLLKDLRRRTDDLSEALEQQTATSEVLKVISRSPGELEPVFQAMLENATRICGAKFGTLFRYDGEVVHLAAQFGTPPALDRVPAKARAVSSGKGRDRSPRSRHSDKGSRPQRRQRGGPKSRRGDHARRRAFHRRCADAQG